MLEQAELFEVPDHWWVRKRCTVCGCALSVTHSHTYVVQRQGWVKIGATDKPRRRLSELARPAWVKHLLSPAEMDWQQPLVVHALIEGDREHELHQEFAGAHVLGEWFLPNAEMVSWLSQI